MAQKVVVSGAVEDELRDRLDEIAKASARTRSQEVRRAVQRHVALEALDDEPEH